MRQFLPIGLSIFLASCGSSSNSPAPSPAAGPAPAGGAATVTSIPATKSTNGDYFVYTRTTTPTGSAATTRSVTRYITGVAADGAYTRTDTADNSTVAVETRTFSSGNALTVFERAALGTSAKTTCSYSVPLLFGPPTGFSGTNFTAPTATESCTGGFVGTNEYNSTHSDVGQESVTIPIGTFETTKFTSTTIIKAAAETSTTTSTTWVDNANARTVKSTSNTSTSPNGSATVTSTSSQVFELAARASNGEAPIGPVVRRFAGVWDLTLAGAASGSCVLTVTATGSLSGPCTTTAGAGTVSGSVNAAGAVTGTFTDGTLAVGTLASPLAGTGTWSGGGSTGTWSAKHR
jgi:hypothetical protein